MYDVGAAVVALAAATLVMVATAAACACRPTRSPTCRWPTTCHRGRGLTDFTGDGLTVFGPVQPLLLAPGGRSVMWARLVSASGVAVATGLQYVLLRSRIRQVIAVTAAAVLGAGECLLLVASSAFTETTYIALSLGLLVVLLPRATTARCAAAGTLAGLGFLTRYAGASLIVTGAVVILIAGRGSRGPSACACSSPTWRRPVRWRGRGSCTTSWSAGSRSDRGSKAVRTDRWDVLLRRPFTSLGHTLFGDSLDIDPATTAGSVAVVVIAAAGLLWQYRRTIDALRAGVLVYAATNFVLPVLARALTSNDISSRVMSPMMIPIVFVAALAADTVVRARVGVAVVALVTALWIWQGLALVERVPNMASSGSRSIYSAQLHELVDELPDDAQILTNNPWGVWWQNGREPTLFGFTRPRPGNSHFPISAERTLTLACSRPTYLAWFPALLNAATVPTSADPICCGSSTSSDRSKSKAASCIASFPATTRRAPEWRHADHRSGGQRGATTTEQEEHGRRGTQRVSPMIAS